MKCSIDEIQYTHGNCTLRKHFVAITQHYEYRIDTATDAKTNGSKEKNELGFEIKMKLIYSLLQINWNWLYMKSQHTN